MKEKEFTWQSIAVYALGILFLCVIHFFVQLNYPHAIVAFFGFLYMSFFSLTVGIFTFSDLPNSPSFRQRFLYYHGLAGVISMFVIFVLSVSLLTMKLYANEVSHVGF